MYNYDGGKMAHILSLQEINPCIRSVGMDEAGNTIGDRRIIYDYEFVYCHQGIYKVLYDNHTTTIQAGEMLIITPGIPHQLDYNHAIEVYWVHFDFFYHDNQQDLARYISENRDRALLTTHYSQDLSRSPIIITPNNQLPESYKVSNPEMTKSIFQQLIYGFEDKSFNYTLVCKSHLNQLLADTFCHLETRDITSSFTDEVINSIKSYIKEHCHRKISGPELSNRFFYHQDTLNRHFKKLTGLTIGQYIRKVRIQRAKKLLLETDLSLDSIAAQCGYTDRSHFIKQFYKANANTPTVYRSSNKG